MVAHLRLKRLTAASDVGIEVTCYRDCLDYYGAQEPHIKAWKSILEKHWLLIAPHVQPRCCQELQLLIPDKNCGSHIYWWLLSEVPCPSDT